MKTRALLLWLFIVRRVGTDGKLDIRFISYWSDGRESSGRCCDNEFSDWCTTQCDPWFYLRINGQDGRKSRSLYQSATHYTPDHNTIHFGSSIQGTPNPFIIQVPKALPSSIEIRVAVADYDDTSNDDHMDTLSGIINIQADATKQSAMYTPYTLTRRTTLNITVRAYCDPDWYGSACEKYCKAIPENSHYICNLHTGAKICFEGWKGDNCSQDIDECIESDHICQNGGSCTNSLGSFECMCLEGVNGTQCENINNQCALEPCLNGGTCDGNETDFKCACQVEWTGQTCADEVNFCDSSPCNMGKCTPDLLTAAGFKCDCDFAWVGDKCSQSVDIVNITLLGEINHTNRDYLVDGLNRLITELEEIPGKVDAKLTTHTHKECNCTTTYVQLYFAGENGTLLETDSLARIFESNPDKIINEYLPLPLHPPREEVKTNLKSPDDSWDTNQNVSAILPPVALVLMTLLLLVALCVWRRRSSRNIDENQLSSFVLDVPCNRNLKPPNAMTGSLQDASVPPADYTSLRFLRVDDTQYDSTSNINQPPEDVTLDAESLQGSNGPLGDEASLGTHADAASHFHIVSEDMSPDDVIAHCFAVSSDDNARLGDAATLDTNCDNTSNLNLTTEDMTHGRGILHALNVSPHIKMGLPDVATLRQVTEDLIFDRVMLQDPRDSPQEHARSDEATLRDVYVQTLNTHCDETTGPRTLDSARLRRPSGYPDDRAHFGEVGTRHHVTSYIQPVIEDMTHDPGSPDAQVEDAEYTVIDDEDVEQILEEDHYERIEYVDYSDGEDISQKDPYEKINF